ncbi:MAG: efflux RND transporter periplasmic adaptor subunit [Pirellulaceae bacterium]
MNLGCSLPGGRLSSLLLLVTAFGCAQRNTFVAPPPPEVTVAQPIRQAVTETLEFTGNTRSPAVVEIRSRVTGYLQKVAFEDGANVEAGDLLFVIDPAPFQADFDLAEAAVQKAQAAEQLAKANLARAVQLQKERAIAQQDVDTANAELASASASVKAAAASLRKAELDLGYAEIRAPISGRIGRHLIDAGNLVNAEQSLLAVIENIDPIFAYFYVSESILLRFMQLVRDQVIPDPAQHPPELQLGLQNDDGFPHQGYLDYRELGVDPTTGTISRRGVFPNPDRVLIPGLFVRLRASLGDPTPKLLVEERAIGTDQRGAYLLVVNDENVVEYRSVKLGVQVGGLRVIEQGVQDSEWVVVNGLQRARPGTPVEPQRTEMASSSSGTVAGIGADADESAGTTKVPAETNAPTTDLQTPADSPTPSAAEGE